MAAPVPKCPIRQGDKCSQCVPGATGPNDCGLVWLMRDDWDEEDDDDIEQDPPSGLSQAVSKDSSGQ